ncbi:MAG: IS110 family transposase [Blautia sp.]|nr:IS110 family transposase [Blautia sp.]
MSMHYTVNQKIEQVKNKLFVAIDIGKLFFHVKYMDHSRTVYNKKTYRFNNSSSGFEDLLDCTKTMMESQGYDEAVFGMEPTGHYWLNLAIKLDSMGFMVVTVNQNHTKNIEEVVDGSQQKDDNKDPEGIGILMTLGDWTPYYRPEGVYAEIRKAYRHLEGCTEDTTRYTNQLHGYLDKHLPGYESCFGKGKGVTGALSLAVLKKAALPEDILDLGVGGILNIWTESGLHGTESRAEKIINAVRGNKGYAIIDGAETARHELGCIIRKLELAIEMEDGAEKLVRETVVLIPGAQHLLKIKGISYRTVAGFFAIVGDLEKRFSNAKQLIKLAGLNIIIRSSGSHKGEAQISKRGCPELRTALYRVLTALLENTPAFKALKEHFMKRTDNPLKAIQANVAMCNKLLRIFYAMVTHDEDYDEKKMLGDIKRMDSTKVSSAVEEAGKLANQLDLVLYGMKGEEMTGEDIETIRKYARAMKGLVASAERGSVKATVPDAASS